MNPLSLRNPRVLNESQTPDLLKRKLKSEKIKNKKSRTDLAHKHERKDQSDSLCYTYKETHGYLPYLLSHKHPLMPGTHDHNKAYVPSVRSKHGTTKKPTENGTARVQRHSSINPLKNPLHIPQDSKRRRMNLIKVDQKPPSMTLLARLPSPLEQHSAKNHPKHKMTISWPRLSDDLIKKTVLLMKTTTIK
jgi:hypothetical protein